MTIYCLVERSDLETIRVFNFLLFVQILCRCKRESDAVVSIGELQGAVDGMEMETFFNSIH